MTLFWASPRTTINSTSSALRFDPLVGTERYRRASDWLSSSGHSLALASFTFDPDAPGSVVFAPQSWDHADPASDLPIPTGQLTSDGQQDWNRGFEVARRSIDQGQVGKVVLARQVQLLFDDTVPIATLLARLGEVNPDTYRFAIDGLVGASPELLVAVDGGELTALVLAGTASSVEGLGDTKTAVEHGFAADSVESALRPASFDLVGEQSVLSFGPINHVGTRFVGRLRPGLGILDLVAALHPNAAVGGSPPEVALDTIRLAEPRGRGRYAGPIGWFDTNGNGEFSLALRCGLVRGREVTLYSGGGLVAASVQSDEWDETELKLTPMLRGLGL